MALRRVASVIRGKTKCSSLDRSRSCENVSVESARILMKKETPLGIMDQSIVRTEKTRITSREITKLSGGLV